MRRQNFSSTIQIPFKEVYDNHKLYTDFLRKPVNIGDPSVKNIGDLFKLAGHQGMAIEHGSLGGVAEECKVSNEMEDICIKAKNAVQGQIVGVDLMESKDKGLVVHEVNNTTEFKNTVRVCEVDIPSLMLDYAIESSK